MLMWYPSWHDIRVVCACICLCAICVSGEMDVLLMSRHACVSLCVSYHTVHNTSEPTCGTWIMQEPPCRLRGKTEVGKQMEKQKGGGGVCDWDFGNTVQWVRAGYLGKAAWFLKDENRNDERGGKEKTNVGRECREKRGVSPKGKDPMVTQGWNLFSTLYLIPHSPILDLSS